METSQPKSQSLKGKIESAVMILFGFQDVMDLVIE